MMSADKVLYVIKASDPNGHYRVHFDDRVEFWSKDLRTKLGESKVEQA
jgi:hypothetical protein